MTTTAAHLVIDLGVVLQRGKVFSIDHAVCDRHGRHNCSQIVECVSLVPWVRSHAMRIVDTGTAGLGAEPEVVAEDKGCFDPS